MPVHYVDVDAVRAGCLGFRYLLAQPREIGGEDGGSELDRALQRIGHRNLLTNHLP